MEEKLGPLFHPSTSLSSIILFLSFFSLFFTSHGRRVAIETVWKPTKFLESRQQAASFRVSLSPSSPLPPDNIHDTLWIISGRMVDIETCFLARLLNGAEVEARSDRGYESTIIAKCRRMPWARLLCALHDCARMVLVGASYRLCYTRIRVVGVYTLGRFAHVRIQCRSVDFDDGIGIRFDLLWKGYSHQV